MKITCISDLHGLKPDLKGGDLLIVAGDLTARDTPDQHEEFLGWLELQPYKHKVIVAGNHDGYISSHYKDYKGICSSMNFRYLQDSSCVVHGYKIYGMPWTKPFKDWPFMAPEKLMREKVAKIPYDVDILVTHGPQLGILDISGGECLGCPVLRDRIPELDNLKLHVFGHIHSGYGQGKHVYSQNSGLISVNCSLMTNDYQPGNEPVYLVL